MKKPKQIYSVDAAKYLRNLIETLEKRVAELKRALSIIETGK